MCISNNNYNNNNKVVVVKCEKMAVIMYMITIGGVCPLHGGVLMPRGWLYKGVGFEGK